MLLDQEENKFKGLLNLNPDSFVMEMKMAMAIVMVIVMQMVNLDHLEVDVVDLNPIVVEDLNNIRVYID